MRIWVLLICLFCVLFYFRLFVIITLVPLECWTVQQIWESEPYWYSPFSLYATITVLLFIWSVIEIFIGFRRTQLLVVKVIAPLMAL